MNKILIADDQATSRELVRVALEHFGYEVYEARDAAETLSTARKLKPDLIILDTHLHAHDGSVIASIRREPDLATVPVVALAGSARQADHERALAAGFSGWLAKPIHIQGLLKESERLLR